MVTDHIKDIDNKWERKSILNQTIKLISVVSSYDKIIFTYDVRMVSILYFFIILSNYQGKRNNFITLL